MITLAAVSPPRGRFMYGRGDVARSARTLSIAEIYRRERYPESVRDTFAIR